MLWHGALVLHTRLYLGSLRPHKTITNNSWQGIKWYRNKNYFNWPFFVEWLCEVYNLLYFPSRIFFNIYFKTSVQTKSSFGLFLCYVYSFIKKSFCASSLFSVSIYNAARKTTRKNLSAEKFRIIVNGSS